MEGHFEYQHISIILVFTKHLIQPDHLPDKNLTSEYSITASSEFRKDNKMQGNDKLK